MDSKYNAKYYSMPLIPKYRHDYISLKLKWLIDLLELRNNDWPVDCLDLLRKIKLSQIIPFEYGFSELPEKYDAVTQYICEHALYILLINQNKVNYPFAYSYDRRLNFTLAHELAHIALEHLLIPLSIKTEQEKALEENEADEFAGRFLMPEKLLLSCNYYSLGASAEYFKVSKTALWKRLNNMKRLDLLHSKIIKACSCCGNTKFSIFAEFCGICGASIMNGLKGIQRIDYPQQIQMDQYKRVKECPACHSQHFIGDKCARCNTFIFNYCSDYFNENGDCAYANPGNLRFCEMCGKPTYFYQRGFLGL